MENLIEPVYAQDSPNASIQLGNIRARLEGGNIQHELTLECVMQFIPQTSLLFRVAPEHVRVLGPEIWHVDSQREIQFHIHLPASDIKIPVINSANTMVPKKVPVVVTSDCSSLKRVVAHLFNYPDFYGTTINSSPQNKNILYPKAITLEADGWLIKVAPLKDTSKRNTALKNTGGYLLTHMVELSRKSGEIFSSEQLKECLLMLYYFLSFSIGRRAGLAFVCGFDEKGERVWEEWGLPRSHSGAWQPAESWFCRTHAEMLQDVFSGFVSTWGDPLWREPLVSALNWYVEANVSSTGIGVDTRLILAQAALETLAWTQCVQSKRMISKRAFGRGGLSAADKLRLLLSCSEIPASIPCALKTLQSKTDQPWQDGPDAITGIRNNQVHPEKDRRFPNGTYYDAYKLALWYIELSLLNIFGYKGRYVNRITAQWVTDLESVPWANASDSTTNAR